jgi:flagellar hook-associated protein 3 FlgL
MRITDRLLVDKVLNNIQRNESRLARLQEQVATGRRITVPSDDPTGAVRSLTLRSNDDETTQSQLNLDLADGWLNATDIALQDVNSIIQRARELAVQGANETLSQQETKALSTEVDQLIGHAIQLANTRSGDRYIFGGFSTKAQPFDMLDMDGDVTETASAATAWQYNGDNGEIQRAVAPGVKLGVNVTGDRVFPQVFDVLIGIRDDLRNRFQTSLSEDRLDELDSVHDDVLDALGEVGAKGARLEITKRQLSAQHLNDTGLISLTENVDMSDAIIHLSAQEAALQASLATGARVIQPKLMDFLR